MITVFYLPDRLLISILYSVYAEIFRVTVTKLEENPNKRAGAMFI